MLRFTHRDSHPNTPIKISITSFILCWKNTTARRGEFTNLCPSHILLEKFTVVMMDDMSGMNTDDMSGMQMDNDDTDELYCSGSGVSMYMAGFVWGEESNDGKFACLNMWFRNWTLDTKEKFYWAIAGTAALGIVLELSVKLRRDAAVAEQAAIAAAADVDRFSTKLAWNGLRLLLMILHSSFAYLLMITAMTYRAELFIAAVAGLGLGHALFNLNAPMEPVVTDSSACHPTSTPAPATKSSTSTLELSSAEAAEEGEANNYDDEGNDEEAKESTVASLEGGVAAAVESLSAATMKKTEQARKQLDLARQRHDAEAEKRALAVLTAAQKAAADHAEFYALAYATAAAESGKPMKSVAASASGTRDRKKPANEPAPENIPEPPASNWTLSGIGSSFVGAL